MKNKIFRAVVKISLVSLLLAIVFQFNILPVKAAALTGMSATFERLKVSESSNQTIQFTSTSGVANTDMIEIGYPALEFGGLGGKVGLGEDDVEFYNVTTAHTYTDDSTSCAGAEEVYVNVAASSIRLFFCPGPGASVAAGDVIRIYVGAFTTETAEDGDFKLINPVAAGTKVITLFTGPFGIGINPPDIGTMAVPIVDSDQVIVTANIDALLTFDLDTNTTAWTGGDDAAPYSVNLGTLTAGAVATSADGGSVNYIYVDLATNGIGGAVITVRDVGDGAAGGLYSASRLKNILSGTAVLSPGTEGYGICVRQTQATSGSFVGTGVYNTLAACATHSVGALSLTPTDILNTAGAPATGGRAQILVKAAINSLTPAATDYTDTLTFIATSTF